MNPIFRPQRNLARSAAGLLILMSGLVRPAGCGAQPCGSTLLALNPDPPLLKVENRPGLFERLVAAFDRDYAIRYPDLEARSVGKGMDIYYLQRELQSLIDMWQATARATYLDQAKALTLKAIAEAAASPRPLVWHGQSRGEWPCFYRDSVEAETGGHSQLCDFQGSVGFLMVACALRQVNDTAWHDIADFVERDIVEKWLYYKPSITQWHMQSAKSFSNVLAVLNTARDVREHFAVVCLDLDKLESNKYTYRAWAQQLIDLDLTVRYDPNQAPPHAEEIACSIPENWGLWPRWTDDGDLWLFIPNYDPNDPFSPADTSHANRAAWLAAKAWSEGLLDGNTVEGLINTLKLRIWAPDKGGLYFNNYVDGSDGPMAGLAGGRGGNVWFGWHRLAAFDRGLEDLFLSVAYDLTNGGPNLPDGAQNKTMTNAPLCLEAWGARLLSPTGKINSLP
jgi:hypothetical protein